MNKSTQSKNVRFNIIPLSSQVTPLDESWNELHVNKEDTNNVVVPSDNTEEQDIQVCCVIAYPPPTPHLRLGNRFYMLGLLIQWLVVQAYHQHGFLLFRNTG